MASDYKYKRVLLKLSGEALMGEAGYGIDPKVVEELAVQIKEIVDDGIQLAVTVGGGNIFRGLAGSAEGMDRAHLHECTCSPRRFRAPWHPHACNERYRDAPGFRALYSPSCRASP